jgi:hypothetical protein
LGKRVLGVNMYNTCSVGVKFRDLGEITQQELQERMLQVDNLAIENGRRVKVQCRDRPHADVYYDFLNEDRAIRFLTSASNVPGVKHCVYDSQPLF